MSTRPKPLHLIRRQGQLVAFSMTGAMAMALTACGPGNNSGPVMVAPPNDFNTGQASNYSDTNQPPSTPYVHAGGGAAPFLGGQGYYPIYGYPGYYYRPAPGSSVELVTGGSPGYFASSPAAARDDVARGGFGQSGGAGAGE